MNTSTFSPGEHYLHQSQRRTDRATSRAADICVIENIFESHIKLELCIRKNTTTLILMSGCLLLSSFASSNEGAMAAYNFIAGIWIIISLLVVESTVEFDATVMEINAEAMDSLYHHLGKAEAKQRMEKHIREYAGNVGIQNRYEEALDNVASKFGSQGIKQLIVVVLITNILLMLN